MMREVVKAWTVRKQYKEVIKYLRDVEVDCYGFWDDMPTLVKTEDQAKHLLSNTKKDPQVNYEIVEVDYVIKAKSWVPMSDPDVQAYVKVHATHHHYMRALALSMGNGTLRLNSDNQWEVYQ